MTDEREDRLRRLMEKSGESTKAGAIDAAVKHYLHDLQNKKKIADDLDTEVAAELSTPWLPIRRETSVGVDDEE
jgi:hypothetical protein